MSLMELITFAVLLLLIFGLTWLRFWLVKNPKVQSLESAIEAEMAKATKGRSFPGFVVGVYKDERVLIRGYGTVSKDTCVPPAGNTVFQIGSISKLLTAMLLQRLCDEGVVSMDATLNELLGTTMPLSESVQSITLRQLVTHTSGLPRVPKLLLDKIVTEAGRKHIMRDPYSHLERQDVFDYLASAKVTPARGRFKYSNYGVGLLAHVLELVTAEDYESLVVEKVLRPLGLKNTAVTLSPRMKEHLAQGYTTKGLPTPVWTFSALGGAGAFSSTAEDLVTLIQACVSYNGIGAGLFREMSKAQFKGASGIGWLQPSVLDRIIGNRNVVWHSGMVGGYASYLAIDRESSAGIVILTNRARGPEMLGMMLMRKVRTRLW